MLFHGNTPFCFPYGFYFSECYPISSLSNCHYLVITTLACDNAAEYVHKVMTGKYGLDYYRFRESGLKEPVGQKKKNKLKELMIEDCKNRMNRTYEKRLK